MDPTSTTKDSNFLQIHRDYIPHVRSAPNSRSNSLKCDKLSNYPLECARKSLPNQCLLSASSLRTADIGHCVRLFRMTASGTENLGDGFRCTDGSITSNNNASLNEWLLLHTKRKRGKSVSSEGSSIGSFSSSGYFRVPILGLGGVGKATLLQNLKVSRDRQNSMSPVASYDKDAVHVVLNGDESTIEFMIGTDIQMDDPGAVNADAYVVAFAVDNRKSFLVAIEMIAVLRDVMDTDRPIILVANKMDLVRKREIKFSEAKMFAEQYQCKYVETSVILQMNMDELLVCLLRQIHLKLHVHPDPGTLSPSDDRHRKQRRLFKGAKSLFNKLFNIHKKTHYYCEDLFNA